MNRFFRDPVCADSLLYVRSFPRVAVASRTLWRGEVRAERERGGFEGGRGRERKGKLRGLRQRQVSVPCWPREQDKNPRARLFYIRITGHHVEHYSQYCTV